jgi:hypothetical protein
MHGTDGRSHDDRLSDGAHWRKREKKKEMPDKETAGRQQASNHMIGE